MKTDLITSLIGGAGSGMLVYLTYYLIKTVSNRNKDETKKKQRLKLASGKDRNSEAARGTPATTPSGEISLDNETKKCPACAEIIKLEAKKCRFCGEQLDPEEVARVVEARRASLAEMLAEERQGKKQCPQCGNWDVRWATIEDGGVGDWCPHCLKSLKVMGLVH